MILKLKVADPLSDADVPQFRNYLPATRQTTAPADHFRPTQSRNHPHRLIAEKCLLIPLIRLKKEKPRAQSGIARMIPKRNQNPATPLGGAPGASLR
jgi:hypothetical protein